MTKKDLLELLKDESDDFRITTLAEIRDEDDDLVGVKIVEVHSMYVKTADYENSEGKQRHGTVIVLVT